MTNDEIETLEPCPFCNQALVIERYGHRHPYTPEIKCPMNSICWTKDSKDFEAWNTRALAAMRPVNQEMLDDRDMEYLISQTISGCLDNIDFAKNGIECRPIANVVWSKVKQAILSAESGKGE